MLGSPWRRPIIASLVIALILVTQTVGSLIYGAARTPQAVGQQLAHHGQAQIAVSMGFTPEEFNLEYLQGFGNIVRVRGDTVFMSGVNSSGMTAIAGQYWVSAVRAWDGR